MKKLSVVIMVIMFIIFSVTAVTAVQAGDCEKYWDELVEQFFEVTIGDIDYSVHFGDSVFGPCPCGTAILSYTNMQVIDDIEYFADIEFEMVYTTSYNTVTVADIDFLLHAGKLIMLPENPLIFDQIIED